MPPFVPDATYRLQFSNTFGFAAAADLVPYLKALGISHIYASPFLRARTGSSHGYDVVDHNRIDPQFGGEADFKHLSAALTDAGMGLILDFVPNHMGIGHADNAWWLDVLEWGPASPYTRFFDIDWHTVSGRRRPAVVLPLLGKPYGEVLEAGELQLAFDAAEGSFSIWYFDHRLPIRPADYAALLRMVLHGPEADFPALDFVRGRTMRDLDRQAAAELKAMLAASPAAAKAVEAGLAAYNSPHDRRAAGSGLHKLLLRQHYLLAYWRSSAGEINYRRFFDINDLAGLRMEDEQVFAATHRLVGTLIQENRLHGLRLDHIDGLYDPAGYCQRLGKLVDQVGKPRGSVYILIEKILGDGERLPAFPNVAGTTGYEWLNAIGRLFVDDRGLPVLEDTWRDFTGQRQSYSEMEQAAKAEAISAMFAGELETLARLLRRIAAGSRLSQDFATGQLRTVLLAYVQALPVYRTYVTPQSGASDQDRAIINAAVAAARKAAPHIEPPVFDFLADLLTLDLLKTGWNGYSVRRARLFIGKLQQFTGPVMAKALEDTCFYRHLRLLPLNEVGGHPDITGVDSAAFHTLMQQRIGQQPHGLTATATHDTKRGEDARVRLLALSEMAEEWQTAVQRWHLWNAPLASHAAGQREPSLNHEYLLYQALLGAWPLAGPDEAFVTRATAYALKAARESKQETSWHYPDASYESALERFVRGILDPQRPTGFFSEFNAMAKRVALLGALNGLSQLAIKLTMPGVPDIYQGTEFWDLSFVDPDNRRPVDFDRRKQCRALLHGEVDWSELIAAWPDGRVKLALLQTILQLRRARATLFREGTYCPASVRGEHAASVVAFSRTDGSDRVVVAVGRLMAGLSQGGRHWLRGPDWSDTVIDLPEGRVFQNALQSDGRTYRRELPLSDGFAHLPVAVFTAIAKTV